MTPGRCVSGRGMFMSSPGASMGARAAFDPANGFGAYIRSRLDSACWSAHLYALGNPLVERERRRSEGRRPSVRDRGRKELVMAIRFAVLGLLAEAPLHG